MKKSKWFILLLLSFYLTLFSISCDKGGGGSTDSYIPDLSRNWINTANANDNFNFSAPSNVATGTFTGTENIGATTNNFKGNFNHSAITIEFTSGVNNTKVLTGTINGAANPVTMTVSTTGLSYTLKQQ